MRRSPIVLVFCLTALLAGSKSHAADWPEFRGPSAEGHADAKNLPTEWSAEKNVVWKHDLAGQGWSSPSLVGGRLYLTAAVPAEGAAADSKAMSLRAIALDAKSGKEIWNVEVFEQGEDAPNIHGKNSHASPTPLVSSGRIFVHFGHMGLACLDINGKIVWKNNGFKYSPVHGNGGSPALVDGRLIFACDGGSEPCVRAVDASTGEDQWRFARPGNAPKKFAFCTPLVITVKDKKQVIIPGAGSVSALDPVTGKEIWHVKYDGYSVIPRPVFGQGLIFISTGYDSPSVLAIRPDGTDDVTETHVVWKLKKGAPHTPSMLLVGKELYMVSDAGIASCVDALTGEPHWQKRVAGNYSSSLVMADGKIYLQSEDGSGSVILPGTTFEQIATNGFGERTLASYAIGDNAIFIRTDKSVYRVENLSR